MIGHPSDPIQVLRAFNRLHHAAAECVRATEGDVEATRRLLAKRIANDNEKMGAALRTLAAEITARLGTAPG